MSTFLMFAVPKVNATVGGETFIYNLKYNPSDESVYFIQEDLGGRGCPPELKKISLNSEKSTVVYSCDQGEKIPFDNVAHEIEKITKGFKTVTPLDLKSNAISVVVAYVSSEKFDQESDEIIMRHFNASIYQNGKKIKELPITGCSMEQPFTIQGYAIPGFNKKIVVLLSAKNNCYEGGYIFESLYVVGGVDALNKTVQENFTKGPSALLPNDGNLVVYAQGTSTSVTTATTTATTTIKNTPVPVTTATSEVVIGVSAKKSLFSQFLEWLRRLFSFF